MALYDNVIVWDTGTATIKSGLASNASPSYVFPCLIGDDIKSRPYVGDQAESVRGVLELRKPVDRGFITHWDDMEKILSYAFAEMLRISPEDYMFLLSEPPMNPKSNREKMAQIMFESFGSLALYIANQSVLSLFATGRNTGIVLDSGEGTSDVVPIYEGYCLPHAVVRSHVAGGEITDYLMRILSEKGYRFSHTYSERYVRDIKEKLSYVDLDYDQLSESPKNCINYELPDGEVIKIGSERYRCTEPLFHPLVIGRESEGIPQIICNSIMKCDADIRQDLWENLVLSGGTTMCPGFAERLNREISEISRPGGLTINMVVPPERKYGAWMGGSIFASLGTFQKMSVSKTEYEEYGSSIVHRKCF